MSGSEPPKNPHIAKAAPKLTISAELTEKTIFPRINVKKYANTNPYPIWVEIIKEVHTLCLAIKPSFTEIA
jgi:hypothetical protein